jgi:hypothetical protein
MDERDAVEDNESVFRRIHRTFVDLTLRIPIRAAAFRPNENDAGGLSVFRARFVQPQDTLKNIDPSRAKEYFIASLRVADLRSLGLTVEPDPAPGGPVGHALIPQLSWVAYQAHKKDLKEIQAKLAELASAAIVLRPR